jgi:hypothetical protein
MDAFDLDNLPADMAAELEGKFFWWQPARSRVRGAGSLNWHRLTSNRQIDAGTSRFPQYQSEAGSSSKLCAARSMAQPLAGV